MFNTRYEAVSAMNEVAELATKLGVERRTSEIGITILNGEPKFFRNADEKELKKAKDCIFERCNPELQTRLM